MAPSPRFMELIEEMKAIHLSKNAGYSGKDNPDPFANFRFASRFGVTAFLGCLIRMRDKFIRISNLVKNPANDQVNENIKDTLMDMAVYCLIAVCLREEEENGSGNA